MDAGSIRESRALPSTTPNLGVRTADPDVTFVMKPCRADALDQEDLVALWPLCGFTDTECGC